MTTRKFSNYPNGFPNGVTILNMPVLNAHFGEARWVLSTSGSDGNKGTRDRPLATLSKAVSLTASNGGDLIVLGPGHKETLADALAIDTTGVTIVGLGSGAQRPKILLSGGNATDGLDITVNDVTIQNVEIIAGTQDMTSGIDVDASGFTARNVEFTNAATHQNFISAFEVGSTTDNTCDDLTIEGCRYYTATDSAATTNLQFVKMTGDIDRANISYNQFLAPASTVARLVDHEDGDDCQALTLVGNFVHCINTATESLMVNNQSDNTGIVAYNLVRHADDAAPLIVDVTGVGHFENYVADNGTESGFLWPVAATAT